jgi:hypothetical protein
MSLCSTDVDWLAPVPQVFTRCDTRVFWLGERRARPHNLADRHARELKALTQGLPPELTPVLRQRFKPMRGRLIWEVPPSLPLSMRQPYEVKELGDCGPNGVCGEVCITAGMIERLLNTPGGLVTGLTHNFLFLMQMLRLRQLWEEVQRRVWEEDPLVIFERALG